MRVLVTGAGGNLGRAAVPALAAAGHHLRLLDFRPLPTDHETVAGDVRDPDVLAHAMEGVDAIVHGAALHGVHLDTWSAEDFWSINATGTFNIYEAARDAGVRRIVLASSMVVYGGLGGSGDRWGVRTEQSPHRPADLYGTTKIVTEHIARSYAHQHDTTSIALRLGMFVPETFERYGFRLLFGGVDDRDVGQAVTRAIDHQTPDKFAAFNIMADSGFGPDDLRELDEDLTGAIESRWPGTLQLAQQNGLDLEELMWGRLLFPIQHAREVLGYQPAYNFDAFLRAWRRGDTAHYPFAHEPWWGAARPT